MMFSSFETNTPADGDDHDHEEFERFLRTVKPEPPDIRFSGMRTGPSGSSANESSYITYFFIVMSVAATVLILLSSFYSNDRTLSEDNTDSTHFADGSSASPSELFVEFKKEFRLAGILTESVVLENIDTEEQFTLQAGDTLAGFQIAKIMKDRILLHDELDNEFTWLMRYGKDIDPLAGEATTAKPVFPITIQGRILDPQGALPDSATLWVHSTTKTTLKYIGSVTDGRYKVELRETVGYMTVRLSTGLLMVKVGPYNSSQTVDFDFSNIEYFTIQGTVSDEAGKPVPDAVIRAGDKYSNIFVPIPYSDSRGHYEIKCDRSVVKITVRIGSMFMVENGLWEEDATVDFSLQDHAKNILIFEGTVTNRDGTPFDADEDLPKAVGMRMRPSKGAKSGSRHYNMMAQNVTAYDAAGAVLGTAVSDTNGHYELRALGPVKRLVAKRDHFMNMIKDGPWASQDSQESPIIVNFDFSDNTQFTILTGKIMFGDEPLSPGASLSAFDASGIRLGGARVQGWNAPAQKGKFVYFSSVPIAYVEITTSVGVGQPYGVIRKEGVWDEKKVYEVQWNIGDEFYTIDGHVYGEDGKPAANMTVRAKSDALTSSALGTATTDASGYYQLQVTKAEKVNVMSVYQRYGLGSNKRGEWSAASTVDFYLADENYLSIKGTLIDENGKPMRGVTVTAYGSAWGKGISDANGNYLVKAYGGDTVDYLLAFFSQTGTKFTGPWTSDTTFDIDFRDTETYTITGILKDENGKPISNALVYPFAKNKNSNASDVPLGAEITGNDGSFKVTSTLSLVSITVGVFNQEFSRTLKGSKEEDLQLEFDLSAFGYFTIQGTITDAHGNPVSDASLIANFKSKNGETTDGLYPYVMARSQANGDFYLRSRLRIGNIVVTAGSVRFTEKGPWDGDAVIDIQLPAK